MNMDRIAMGYPKTALKRNTAGHVFELIALWFTYGIGAESGSLLNRNPSMHNPFFVPMATIYGISASVLGWICFLVGQRKLPNGQKQDGKEYSVI
jgi:uncharacterized membrane protein YgdD (TMEM256/DUF423 family)